MTEQVKTEARLEALKTQILQEISVTVGDPNATLTEIQIHMEALHSWMTQQGLDGSGLVAAWERVLTLRTQGERAEDLAAASRAVANDMRDKLHATQEQLTKEQTIYADLITALSDIDVSHPVVGDVYTIVSEEIHEGIVSDGFYSYAPGDEIATVYPQVGERAADMFHQYLFDDSDLNSEESEELQSFIVRFVGKVSTRQRAEIEKRKKGLE